MPLREWKLRIEHILEALDRIGRYTQGMTFEEFAADERTIDAVVRNFTVIGEAARHVPAEVTSQYPSLPWREMWDMRNIVVHAYFGVSEQILWDTIQTDLPPLLAPLREVLEREP